MKELQDNQKIIFLRIELTCGEGVLRVRIGEAPVEVLEEDLSCFTGGDTVGGGVMMAGERTLGGSTGAAAAATNAAADASEM